MWQRGKGDDSIFPSCLHLSISLSSAGVTVLSVCACPRRGSSLFQYGVKLGRRAPVTDRFHLVDVELGGGSTQELSGGSVCVCVCACHAPWVGINFNLRFSSYTCLSVPQNTYFLGESFFFPPHNSQPGMTPASH